MCAEFSFIYFAINREARDKALGYTFLFRFLDEPEDIKQNLSVCTLSHININGKSIKRCIIRLEGWITFLLDQILIRIYGLCSIALQPEFLNTGYLLMRAFSCKICVRKYLIWFFCQKPRLVIFSVMHGLQNLA